MLLLTGPAGLAAAYGTGFYSDINATAWHPHSLLDAVPGDVASSMIIASAALRVAGISSVEELLDRAVPKNRYHKSAGHANGGPVVASLNGSGGMNGNSGMSSTNGSLDSHTGASEVGCPLFRFRHPVLSLW